MGVPPALQAHFAQGTTTLCRCWRLDRRDGAVFGFTDHDETLSFDGVAFRANTGLSAQALSQTTGLSVDNTEALGALSDAAVTAEDLAAGRFDGAEVRSWLVNWQAPSQRHLVFRGEIGEVRAGGGAFRAELRGLCEALNRPVGRIYQRLCSADLGDGRCRIDTGSSRYTADLVVAAVVSQSELILDGGGSYAKAWFDRGRVEVLDGTAAGLSGMVKSDVPAGEGRRVSLWEEIRAPMSPGVRVRLTAGCDKRAETCRAKFDNFMNFRGFPHIPGEDWVMAYPRQGDRNSGGSLR